MRPEHVDQVWRSLDREHLAQIARSGPEPVFAAISGAHLYGFASRDSDVDLRGAYVLPAREVLGLASPMETITREDRSTVDLDWVAHDIRKFARLIVKGSGDVLEQLYSPLVVLSGPEHEELREIAKGMLVKRNAKHYQGFARRRRIRLAAPAATVKHLLYAYRVLLTGIHLMEAGEVIANLPVLNERFQIPQIDGLAERKREGLETMPLGEKELETHAPILDRLEARLEKASTESFLPETPRSLAALEDLVLRARLRRLE